MSSFKRLTLKAKLIFIVSIFFCQLIVCSIVFFSTVDTLSTLRAFIEGEGHWSKAQKNAIFYLTQYIISKDPQDYQYFLKDLQPPLGDSKARIELIKSSPDFHVTDQGLIQGKNHPSEVRAMALLFWRFQKVSYIQQAMAIWTSGDKTLSELQSIGEEVRRKMQNPLLSSQETARLLQRIGQLNQELTQLEDEFSFTLGEAARWMNSMIFKFFTGMAVFYFILGGWITYALVRTMLRQIEIIRQGTMQIQHGNYGYKIESISRDELGHLAITFGKMAESLARTIQERDHAQVQFFQSSRYASFVKLTGEVAHEINTPLGTIQLILDDLMDQFANNGVDRTGLISQCEMIQTLISKISNKIAHLRSFYRDGTQDPKELISIAECLEGVHLLTAEKLKLSGIRVTYDLPSMEQQIFVRPTQFSQALLNLLNNAYEAVESLPEKWINLSVSKQNDHVDILITDSGSGIPVDLREKIFEPFFSMNSAIKGVSIDLSLSRKLIEANDGQLFIDTSSKNTRFVVRIAIPPFKSSG